jgi:AraC-like DNA-binding protein
VVTLSIGVITYDLTLKLVERDAIESSLSVLDQGRQMMDTRLKEVESMVLQLSLNYQIQAFLDATQPLADYEYDMLREMQSTLPVYKLTNMFVYDTYVYFRNSDTVLSPNHTSSRIDILYNNFLKYADMDLEQWKKKVAEKYYKNSYWPAQRVSSERSDEQLVTYIQSIPFAYYGNPKGAVIVLIRESEMQNILVNLVSSNNGWYYIADQSGQIITSKNIDAGNLSAPHALIGKMKPDEMSGYEQVVLDGQDIFLIYSRSEYNQWTYVAGIPAKAIFAKANYIKKLFFFTALVIFLVGLAIATYLAYRNSKPVREIIRKIQTRFESTGSPGVNEYDFLDGAFLKLIESNASMKSELEKQIPVLKANFFERLFRNGFNRITEIESMLGSIGLIMDWDRYVVFVARIEGYNNEINSEIAGQMDFARVLLTNVITKQIGDAGYFHNIDLDKVALLYGLVVDNEPDWLDNIYSLLKSILEECENEYNIRLTFGVGTIFQSLMEVSKSYHEAVNALEFKNESTPDIILYSNIPKGMSGYYYPMELEARLMNLVKMGDEAEAAAVLDLVYRKNFAEVELSPKMQNELFYEIKGTITKLRQQIFLENDREARALEEKMVQVGATAKPKAAFNTLKEIFLALCLKTDSVKKSHNSKLKNSILEYIHAEYGKDDLCLYKVASRFDLAETYLSHFFKEQIGETFSNYLEKTRMEHAIRLLRENRLSINEIVEQVGYSNTNTFYKAFKRIYGASPREYQKKIIME